MNTFILRWNPAISSYKMEEHKKICEQIKNEVVFYNWSVREWENLHAGDAFALLQVGTENDGIAMIGKFISEPYEGDSWRKDGTKIHYADMQIFYACDLDKKRSFRAVYFEKKFSDIKWHGGHSGEKLSEQVSEELIARIDFALKNTYGFESSKFSDFLKNDNRFLPIDPEEKKQELLSMLAPYNPVVHEGDEDGWDWLWNDGEFAIEIKNPSAETEETSICIAFEDSVDNWFTLYFDDWHETFKMINREYEIFLGRLKSILNNEVYILTAYDKDSGLNTVVSKMLSANGSKVRIAYWNGIKTINND